MTRQSGRHEVKWHAHGFCGPTVPATRKKNVIIPIARLVPLLLCAAITGTTKAAGCSASPIDLEVDIRIAEYGPDGKSWDGALIYMLPFKTTTVSPPEPAVCVYTDTGEAACLPGTESLQSPCPDSYRCTFDTRLHKPFKHITISVFDIDAAGREAGRDFGQLVGKGLRIVEEFVGQDLSSRAIKREVLDANDRRWS